MDLMDLVERGQLSQFAMLCLAGDFDRVQSMLSLAGGNSAQRRRLLEQRVSMMRFTPLMMCITGAVLGIKIQEARGTGGAASKSPSPSYDLQHVAVARVLLEAGARPNAKDVAGFTAFHLATNGTNASEATLQIAAMLPQYGGDPNVRNRFGQTPLIEAVMSARLDVIECLVHAGADASLEDLSCAALSPAEVAASGARPPVTPVNMANSQPKVLKLFSQAELAKAKMEPAVFTCSADGCDKPASKTCSLCLRSWCKLVGRLVDWSIGRSMVG